MTSQAKSKGTKLLLESIDVSHGFSKTTKMLKTTTNSAKKSQNSQKPVIQNAGAAENGRKSRQPIVIEFASMISTLKVTILDFLFRPSSLNIVEPVIFLRRDNI